MAIQYREEYAMNEDFIIDCFCEGVKCIVQEGNLIPWLECCEPEFKELVHQSFYNENVSFLLNEAVKDKIARVDKVASGHVDNYVNKASAILKKILVGNERDNIIENRVKASKVLKELLIYGGVGILNPCLAIFAWFSKTLVKAKMTKKEKVKILNDLNTDLEIIDEKINDAASAGDNKKKYELMRLRNETKKAIQNIKYSPVATPLG